MADLNDLDHDATVPLKRRLLQVLLALVALALVVAAGLALKRWLGQPAAQQRQVARITILPDTPPPPPPPPPPQQAPKPEPPKAQDRPPPPDAPKPVQPPAPANEPIKMSGPAGDGPSAFAAGEITKDYAGGAAKTGPAAASAPPAPPPPPPPPPAPRATAMVDRVQERLYATTTRQLLRDAIERNLKGDSTQASATFSVWIEPDGGIRRFELERSGNAALDAELDAALDETARGLKLPPPPAVQQPLKFRLTLRPQG